MKENLLKKTQLDIFEIDSLNISKLVINELDKLPDGWEWKKLGEIVKTIDGDRGSNYPKKEEFSDNDFCLFLSAKNVRKDKFVFEENIFISKEIVIYLDRTFEKSQKEIKDQKQKLENLKALKSSILNSAFKG